MSVFIRKNLLLLLASCIMLVLFFQSNDPGGNSNKLSAVRTPIKIAVISCLIPAFLFFAKWMDELVSQGKTNAKITFMVFFFLNLGFLGGAFFSVLSKYSLAIWPDISFLLLKDTKAHYEFFKNSGWFILTSNLLMVSFMVVSFYLWGNCFQTPTEKK